MKQAELEETGTPLALEIIFKVYFFTIGIVYFRAFLAGIAALARGSF